MSNSLHSQVTCDWCGQDHAVEDLCRKPMSRRSFTSLVGLGLLGLGLGPHVFDPRAPMLGPRMVMKDPFNVPLFSWRLQPGVFNYTTPPAGEGKRFHAVSADIEGTPHLNDRYTVGYASGIVCENGGSITLTTLTGEAWGLSTRPLIGHALSVLGGLYATPDELRNPIDTFKVTYVD